MIKSLKLIKYGYQFKLNMFFSALFMLLGTVIITLADVYKSASMYLLVYCSFLIIIQVASTLMASGMVKSSPKYRQFCLVVPRIVNIACFFIPLIIVMLIRIIQIGNVEEFKKCIGNELAITSFVYLLFLIYMALVYKFFVISIILFFAGCIFINVMSSFIQVACNFTFVQGTGIAIIFFVLGMVLSEIIIRAIYKLQPSRFAQSASLRKYI